MNPTSDGYAGEGGGIYNDINSQLPFTGIDLLAMGILGALLLLLGLTLTFIINRRARS